MMVLSAIADVLNMHPKQAQTTIDGERGTGVIAARPTRQPGGDGAIPIVPHLVRASGVSKGICDKITDDWHSYIKSTERGARALDYLIYGRAVNSAGDTASEPSLGQIVGTIGFAFLGVRLPAYLTKAVSMGQPRNLDTSTLAKSKRVAACFRYTLMSHVPKNFASQALAASLRLLKRDWLQKYEADLLGIVTFVKPPWTGACFKAANFRLIGTTTGKVIRHSGSQSKEGILQAEQLYTLLYLYGVSNTNKPREWTEAPRKKGLMKGGYYFDEVDTEKVASVVEERSSLVTSVPDTPIRKKKNWPWKVVSHGKDGKATIISYHEGVKEAVSKVGRLRRKNPENTYSIEPTKANKGTLG